MKKELINYWLAIKEGSQKDALANSTLSHNDVIKLEGMLGICKICEFDMNIIKIVIDEKVTSRTTKYKYYKDYSTFIDAYNAFYK